MTQSHIMHQSNSCPHGCTCYSHGGPQGQEGSRYQRQEDILMRKFMLDTKKVKKLQTYHERSRMKVSRKYQ